MVNLSFRECVTVQEASSPWTRSIGVRGLKRLPFNGDIYGFGKWHELEPRWLLLDLYPIECRSDMISRATSLCRSHTENQAMNTTFVNTPPGCSVARGQVFEKEPRQSERPVNVHRS